MQVHIPKERGLRAHIFKVAFGSMTKLPRELIETNMPVRVVLTGSGRYPYVDFQRIGYGKGSVIVGVHGEDKVVVYGTPSK